jgi:hypothetical protein
MDMTTKYDTSDIGGWAIAVETERLDGGAPLMCIYAATFTDKQSAIDLVKERAGLLKDGDKIGDAYPLSKETVAAIGMEPGEADLL